MNAVEEDKVALQEQGQKGEQKEAKMGKEVSRLQSQNSNLVADKSKFAQSELKMAKEPHTAETKPVAKAAAKKFLEAPNESDPKPEAANERDPKPKVEKIVDTSQRENLDGQPEDQLLKDADVAESDMMYAAEEAKLDV